MKKTTFILLFAIFVHQFSFSQIRILEVDPDNNKITLKNFGSANVNIAGNRLCAKFSYVTISNSIIDTGDLSLDANEEVILTWSVDAAGSDLGYYTPSGSFGEAVNMLDFTQWGSAGNGRESVAVTKGIWSTGDFISVSPPYEFTGTAAQTGVSFWQTLVLSIEDQKRLNFDVYPNPSNNIVNVQLPSGIDNSLVSIFDYTGRQVKNQKVNSSNKEINIQDLASGIYILRVEAGDKIGTEQLVKQ